MYNDGSVALGQDTSTTPVSSEGFFSNLEQSVKSGSIFTNLEKGVQTGLSVYDKVQNLQNLIKRRRQAQQQGQQPQVVMMPQAAQPVTMPGSGTDWTTIVLIGVGGLISAVVLAKAIK